MDEIKLFCSKDCPDTCSFYASIKENKSISIIPDKEYFLNKGFVCKKLKNFYNREIKDNNAHSFFIENGQKIESKHILIKLADFLRSGRDKKILLYRGSGSLGYNMAFWDKLFSTFSNCYFVNGSPCDETGIIAHKEDFGICANPDIENLYNTDTIILFGKNAFVSSPHLFVYLQNLKNKGKKIIYIDPVRSQTSILADKFIQINPASDGLLAYLILLNLGYIKNNTYDTEKLKRLINIKNSDLNYLTSNIQNGKTAFIEGFGMQRYSNGKNIIQWINRLAYYTDNVDNLFYSRSSKEGLKKIDIIKRKQINIADTVKLLEKNFFDIVIIIASNPVITMPENVIWERALQRSYTIVIDTNYTETVKYADCFIRVGGMFAQEEIQGSYFFNKTLQRKSLIKNIPSDISIIKSLAKMLSIELTIPKSPKGTEIKRRYNNKRVFKNKDIKLLFPYAEQGKTRLITLSHFDYLNSQTDMTKKDIIYISREIARHTGISDDTDVIVKNKLGEYVFRCFITDRIKGNNAYAYKNRSTFVNSLTKSSPTDAVYALSYYDLFVDIVPIKHK